MNPLDHPICLANPARLTQDSAWHEHIPFAMYLIDILKPDVLVELGVHGGDSYCAFCQAVKELRLGTRCYGVDSWLGDAQAGLYGPEVLADLRAHHDPLYGSFSELVQSSFDEAVGRFSDGTIDVLHIDGYHAYKNVRHDFEAWRTKMSRRGVVVLHDIAVREGSFEVWRLWHEAKAQYPHFEFVHGYGLGVLAVGSDQPRELQELLRASEEDGSRIRRLFLELGQRMVLRMRTQVQQETLAQKERRLQELEAGLSQREQTLSEKDRELRQQKRAVVEKDDELLRSQSQHVTLTQRVRDLESTVLAQQQATLAQEQVLGRLHRSPAWKVLSGWWQLKDALLRAKSRNRRDREPAQVVGQESRRAERSAEVEAEVQEHGRHVPHGMGRVDPLSGSDPAALPSAGSRIVLYASSLGNYFFLEIRDLIASGLQELGVKVEVRDERDGLAEDVDWHVVVAPHEFFYLGVGEERGRQLSVGNLVLVNTEQPSTQWFRSASAYFPKAHCIWDIDYQSAQLTSRRGFACDYLPLGYVAGSQLSQEVKELPDHYGTCFLPARIRTLSCLNQPLASRPIDVMFVGGLTPRREAFFAQAAPVLSSYVCYLHLSDASAPLIQGRNTQMDTATLVGLAQRSKIILNIHRDREKYFEAHRIVMHGLWHRALVISEPCTAAPPFQPGVDFVAAPLEAIPERVRYHLSSPGGSAEAQAIAAHGFRTLAETCRLSDVLRPLLGRLYPREP